MKNMIYIIRKIGNQYKKIGQVKYKEHDKMIRYKKDTIPIPPKNGNALTTDKQQIMFFDLDNKQFITFEKTDLGLSTSFLDKLFNQEAIGQLIKAVKKASQEDKTNWDFAKTLIIGGICALGGYLIGIGGF